MIVSEFTDFWKDFERYFGKRCLVDKCRIFLDGCREYRRSLTPCPMYGLLRFDRLSRDERAKYVTLGSLLKFARRVNDPVKAEFFFDKCSFHRLLRTLPGGASSISGRRIVKPLPRLRKRSKGCSSSREGTRVDAAAPLWIARRTRRLSLSGRNAATRTVLWRRSSSSTRIWRR